MGVFGRVVNQLRNLHHVVQSFVDNSLLKLYDVTTKQHQFWNFVFVFFLQIYSYVFDAVEVVVKILKHVHPKRGRFFIQIFNHFSKDEIVLFSMTHSLRVHNGFHSLLPLTLSIFMSEFSDVSNLLHVVSYLGFLFVIDLPSFVYLRVKRICLFLLVEHEFRSNSSQDLGIYNVIYIVDQNIQVREIIKSIIISFFILVLELFGLFIHFRFPFFRNFQHLVELFSNLFTFSLCSSLQSILAILETARKQVV